MIASAQILGFSIDAAQKRCTSAMHHGPGNLGQSLITTALAEVEE
jgi:hypothetical protein